MTRRSVLRPTKKELQFSQILNYARGLLYSLPIGLSNGLYTWEKYAKIPCATAIKFLKALDLSFPVNMAPMHKITNYQIIKGSVVYNTNTTETALKVAAKIELFMENPDYLSGK